MFSLLYNFYEYIKKKSERKLTLVTLGLDNAGKTTIINTMQGLLDKEVTATFGFNSQTLNEGKYKVEVFDLGGSTNMRRIWKTYLSEVHGVIYVVDAADQQRFEESRKALEGTLAQAHMYKKPVLVFANKQDLPTAAAAGDVASALGLTEFQQNQFNIMGCIAKVPPGQLQPDPRIREGLKWIVSQVNAVFSTLDVRVKQEHEVVKADELKKKKEREEMARKMKEARLQRQLEEQNAAAVQEQTNALATLPNQIESPSKLVLGSQATEVPALSPLGQFSDLQRPDQGPGSGQLHGVVLQGPATSSLAPTAPVKRLSALQSLTERSGSSSGHNAVHPESTAPSATRNSVQPETTPSAPDPSSVSAGARQVSANNGRFSDSHIKQQATLEGDGGGSAEETHTALPSNKVVPAAPA